MFQLDLVMSSVLILSVMAALMYQSVVLLQKFVSRWFGADGGRNRGNKRGEKRRAYR